MRVYRNAKTTIEMRQLAAADRDPRATGRMLGLRADRRRPWDQRARSQGKSPGLGTATGSRMALRGRTASRGGWPRHSSA